MTFYGSSDDGGYIYPSQVRRNRRKDLLPNPRLPRSGRVRDRWTRMRPRPSMTLSVPIEDIASMHPSERRAFFDSWIQNMRKTYGQGHIYEQEIRHPGLYVYEFVPDRSRNARAEV